MKAYNEQERSDGIPGEWFNYFHQLLPTLRITIALRPWEAIDEFKDYQK